MLTGNRIVPGQSTTTAGQPKPLLVVANVFAKTSALGPSPAGGRAKSTDEPIDL